MGPIETALLRTASSLVSKAGVWWLGRRRSKRERETSLADLIGTGILDDMGVRGARRRVDDIVDVVYQRLEPLINQRDGGLPENEVLAALAAVSETLRDADLSDRAIFADDVDAALMARRLRRELADVPERAGLSEGAVHLYQRVLNESCVCLTQLLVQLGPFQARVGVQTLERLTAVAGAWAQVLDRVPMASLDAPAGDRFDDEFRRRYLAHVADKLDVLELFGVDVRRYRLQTKLSIAYISLSVTEAGGRAVRRGFRWKPGRFRQEHGGESTSVRAEQALGSADRILLRGEAGSGKTTLLQWVAVTAARQRFTGALESWNGRTPFRVRLRDYVKQALPPPEEFLDRLAGTIAGQAPALWVHRQLQVGAILLVDGVDEVPAGQRREVRVWLQDLLREYPDLRVVVTTRPAAASGSWLGAEGFASVFLERMSPADIKALIRHWHDAVGRADDLPCEPHRLPGYEQRLLAQLDGSAHLQNLAGSPLLCAMLCALNLDRDSNLPRKRMDIYQAAVDMLLFSRDDKRGVHNPLPDLTADDQLQVLQETAWWMTLNGRTELPRERAVELFGARLASIRHIEAPAGEVLDHVIERSGVFREPVPGRVDFVHRTFQEYLAAREAAYRGNAGALVERAHLDTWRETVILAAGHANQPVCRELFAGLLDRADELPQHARKLRLLAAACLETASWVDPVVLARIHGFLRELMPRTLAEARSVAAVGEPLLAQLPSDLSGLSEARATAVVASAALVNGPQAMAVLAGYAKDPRSRVQRQLAAAWEYFDPADYADQILAEAPLDNGEILVNSSSCIPFLGRLQHTVRTSVSLRQKVDLALFADVPGLYELTLSGGFIGGFRDLAGHGDSLRRLTVNHLDKDQDLRELEVLPGLEWLTIWNGFAGRVAPLPRLPRLTHLILDDYGIGADVFFEGSKLRSLSMWNCPELDPEWLSPLRQLEVFGLTNSVEPIGGITGLVDQLGSHPELQYLYLDRCPWLTDLEEIARLRNLSAFTIDESQVLDLRPLAALQELGWVSLISETDVFDITPLAGLPRLHTLQLGASVSDYDLSPLAGRAVTLSIPRHVRLRDGQVPPGIRVARV
ncbi:NACHT domain-containing protein [Actinoplanes subglobosus]|uniref:NACHT domain-containing protein n=1 Tax=Actinoplanes subglobosus TaxID=1547892 RepID=A0ABV8J3D8_9ACTN